MDHRQLPAEVGARLRGTVPGLGGGADKEPAPVGVVRQPLAARAGHCVCRSHTDKISQACQDSRAYDIDLGVRNDVRISILLGNGYPSWNS